ncbi:FtsK/SpoIIIE family DNA translocase [Haliovirga abyssi]|uniref:DNA translocase FtsK n=1 Tax=Haliovirga abyssi TaxID=2996794 RepID=A0AAU9DHD3_9FUSO|nr:DNA translocase FtsK 4TM domain-containing protein [Haliovirga abyssi]BDU50932.1 DNA translocase FtsK [Haliovirga abyssi]
MSKNLRNELLGIFFLGIGGYIGYVLSMGNNSNEIGFVGKNFYNVFFLLLGVMTYAVPFIFFLYGIVFLLNRNLKMNKVKFYSFLIFFVLLSAILVLKGVSVDGTKKDIIKELLRVGGNSHSGGLFGAFISIFLFTLFGKTGAIIFLITFTVIDVFIFANKMIKSILFSFLYPFIKIKMILKRKKEEKIANLEKIKEKKLREKEEKNIKLSREKEKKIAEKLLKRENKRKKIDKDGNISIKYEEEEILSENIENKKQFELKEEENINKFEEKEIEKEDKIKKNELKDDNWELIFNTEKKSKLTKSEIEEQVKLKTDILEQVLTEYGIEAKVINYERGPVITRYELSIPRGIRVKKIVALSDDLAMNLEAKSIRIEAPIPGKNAVGIEIPNDTAEAVYFSKTLKSKEFKKSKSPVSVILGENIVGENVIVDLRKMPHLLIAGRTGSGKSVCINSLISSIISKSSHEEVKFIMVDPKMVELMPYNGIPHLLVPVIIEPKLAALALKWAVNNMEERYRLLSKTGVRNLEGYNKLKGVEKLPYIVIVIDELADLMMVAPASIEESIARIAQKARAIGIHLVVATQRPTTDVITGTIKANLPSRISFSVASQIDSRTILDTPGAEKLLGKGDMLFLESGSPNLVRIQGAFITDEEVNKLTDYLKSKNSPEYLEEIITESTDDTDELFTKAIEIIKNEGKVSISLIQRKLKVGYARAARIVDQLEDNGIINDKREILIDV